MGNSNVKQHLDTAEKTGACQLSKSGLKEVSELYNFLIRCDLLRPLDIYCVLSRCGWIAPKLSLFIQ